MRTRLLVVTLVFLLCAACEPTIDASTPESTRDSIAKMKELLPPEKQEEFQDAVKVVMSSGVNPFEGLADPAGFIERSKAKIDGKSVDQIMAEAAVIQEERRIKQREQVVGEIDEVEGKLAELAEKKVEIESQLDQLKSIEVTRSRFYWRDSSFMMEPVIELSVTNNSEHAIARVFFHGVLATPGRSVPWVEDDFNYSISGGLESGESATWSLAPNSFGDWGKGPKDRDDMVLTVDVFRVDGADGEPILDGRLSGSDERELERYSERLTSLQESLGELGIE